MWAQIVKARVTPDGKKQMRQLVDETDGPQNEREGWLRTIVMEDQDNPELVYTLVLFENEDIARRGEQSPDVEALTRRLQQIMQGTPEFINLNVLTERSR